MSSSNSAELGNHILHTIFRESVKDNVPLDVPLDVPLGQDLDEVILTAIRKNNKVTRAAIAKIAYVSEKTVGRRISELHKIKFIGTGWHGHWEILEEKTEN